MIVLGADTHKRSHTIAAVSAVTGELVGEKSVQVGARGFAALLVWARGLESGERVWALEDCRQVSGSFERFLIARGERVVRVTTKLMADSRRRARARQVRQHRLDRGRAGRAARRPRRAADGAAGRARARSAAAGRPPRAPGPSAGRDQQHAAVASARPLARAGASGQRADVDQVEPPDLPAPGARRADDARPDRAR